MRCCGMTEFLINHIQICASHAQLWGYLFIFVFMAIESSFIPFPSEVVMIPAGFLAYRGELTLGTPLGDLALAVFVGLLGSMSGAYFNYYCSLWLGRPFLHKFGKYFFLPPHTLDRAEEIFREYGDITTFVCRLLPAIRQLISIPAGLSRMNFGRFSFFTGLGAGIWCLVLALTGYYLASLAKDKTYAELVHDGMALIKHNYVWMLLFLAGVIAVYIHVHRKIMGGKAPTAPAK